MGITRKTIGRFKGKSVVAYTLTCPSGFSLTALNYGCIVTELLAADSTGEFSNVVLAFDRLEDYESNPFYLGAVIGRIAGRTRAEGLPLNEGANHLHGGAAGFHSQFFETAMVEGEREQEITFRRISEAGEEGYPGTLDVAVTYTIRDEGVWSITYEAMSDTDTPFNPTNHSYFNLNGYKTSILGHRLTVASDQVLQLDQDSMPTGGTLSVAGSDFDLRKGATLAKAKESTDPQLSRTGGFDHPFILSRKEGVAAVLQDEICGRVLEMTTDAKAVVVYMGSGLEEGYQVNGKQLHPYAGVCLEAQGYPNAYREPRFPSIVLKAGETFKQQTSYTFSLAKPTDGGTL
ncbi:aldose epimerase family protein [Shouchella shacheensis]|uniref:aldose epimerase family protein n=1 Tax=Shouchella shacheensis TaxID=1649580 RepID=UPI0007405284|nr:aldose epimerase family protein [Shouchella shacheensis]